MYLSRTNSCELTFSVAYEMERSDSAVDDEPTLSASLLSRRSSPPAPRTLLFLPENHKAPKTNQNQNPKAKSTHPAGKRTTSSRRNKDLLFPMARTAQQEPESRNGRRPTNRS